jgi:hypothetical protein
MSCVNPLKAYQCLDKSIVFDEVRKHDIVRSLSLPCGQCIGCRLERSRQWAMRCMHEAQLHEENCFITLTYNDKYLPHDQSLNHKHFQLFLKRLRKSIAPKRIRFYMAGEYGSKFGRPHYHACIFGWSPKDKKVLKKTGSGSIIYQSKELDDCWRIKNKRTREYESLGYASVGDVTFESAAYVARYIVSKQTGKIDPNHYHWCDLTTGELQFLKPEYNRMSLRPITNQKGDPGGIGAMWYKKYKSDVYPHDYVVVRGKKMKPPKAYDKLYQKDNPYEYDELLYKREKSAKLNPDNHDPKRLDAKRQILESRLSLLKRTLT